MDTTVELLQGQKLSHKLFIPPKKIGSSETMSYGSYKFLRGLSSRFCECVIITSAIIQDPCVDQFIRIILEFNDQSPIDMDYLSSSKVIENIILKIGSKTRNHDRLLEIIQKPPVQEFINYIVTHGADIGGNEELLSFAHDGSVEKLIEIITKFANENDKTFKVIKIGQITGLIEVTLKPSEELDNIDKNELNLLHYSAKYGIIDLMMCLLKNGCNPDVRTKDLSTTLHLILDDRNKLDPEEMETQVPILLKYGANVNIKDVYGRTPLHILVRTILKNSHKSSSYLLVMTLLFHNKVDLSIEDIYGKCAFKYVEEFIANGGKFSEISKIVSSFCTYIFLKFAVFRNFISLQNMEVYQKLIVYGKGTWEKQILELVNPEKELLSKWFIKDGITMMDVISMDIPNLKKLIQEPQFLRIYNEWSNDCPTPISEPFLTSNIREAYENGIFHDPAAVVLNKITKLPSACIEKILDYLNPSDLKSVTFTLYSCNKNKPFDPLDFPFDENT